MKDKCSECDYSWWRDGEPVNMEPDERTLANGGCGECRRSGPSACTRLHEPRAFPIMLPEEWCGEFKAKSSKEKRLQESKASRQNDVLRILCDAVVRLTEIRQRECPQLSVEDFAAKCFGMLIDIVEKGRRFWPLPEGSPEEA